MGSGGAQYLVQLHFCDIVSRALNLLYYNVYLNGYLAYEDLDLSVLMSCACISDLCGFCCGSSLGWMGVGEFWESEF